LRRSSPIYRTALIEEFMLAANETVARHLTKKSIASIYRVHANPQEEKLRNLVETAHHFGYRLPKYPNHDDIQRLLDRRSRQTYRIHYQSCISQDDENCRILDPQHRAFRTGIELLYAFHFTYPQIPDLIVHRSLDALHGKSTLASRRRRHPAQLQKIADNCSDTERKADEAEKSLMEIAVLRYLDNLHRTNKSRVF